MYCLENFYILILNKLTKEEEKNTLYYVSNELSSIFPVCIIRYSHMNIPNTVTGP